MVFNQDNFRQKIYSSRNRQDDPRLSSFIQLADLKKLSASPKGMVLLGYPDDEGIQNNGGRTGAKDAPAAIRTILGNTTSLTKSWPIYDLGDAKPEGSLEQRQESVRKFLGQLPAEHFPLSLGGGNDWAFADAAAFVDRYGKSKKKVVVINVDAHLDVRRPNPDINSGSPFYQLMEKYPNVQLVQLGYQDHLCSETHVQYCQKKKAIMISRRDMDKAAKVLAAKIKGRPDCFLCVDIDGFSSSIAPGCSAPHPGGLLWPEYLAIFSTIFAKTKLRGLGIYEVNPNFDQDGQTARLAAAIIQEAWRALSWKS